MAGNAQPNAPDNGSEPAMRAVRRLWLAGYILIAALFFVSALVVVAVAALELFHALGWSADIAPIERFSGVLEVIGLLTIAVAALELGQTIVEEEIIRGTHVSAPTRVRRFLSRFMIVVVVALSIECLVSVFQLAHEDPTQLPYAATIGLAAAALLAAWGWFLGQNRRVEELEPEAMQAAKAEDRKVDE